MNLPLINPMKSNDKNRNQPVEQFGLGIQVFKIDPKADRHEPGHTRKAIQHIENPKNDPSRQPSNLTQHSLKTHKKPHVLPSLSTEKKLSATYSEPRRKTLEKGTPRSINKGSKEVREIKEMREIKEEKVKPKPSKVKEGVPPKEPPKEKEVVQMSWISPLNEIPQFELDLEAAEIDNQKEIRRLKKEKENIDEDELQRRLNWREVKTGLVQSIVQTQDPFFGPPEEWEECSIADYVKGRGKFPLYDTPSPEEP